MRKRMAGNWCMFPRAFCKFWVWPGILGVNFPSFLSRSTNIPMRSRIAIVITPLLGLCSHSLGQNVFHHELLNVDKPGEAEWCPRGSTGHSDLSLCQGTGFASLQGDSALGRKSSWALHTVCGLGQPTVYLWDHQFPHVKDDKDTVPRLLWELHKAMWNGTWSLQGLCKG